MRASRSKNSRVSGVRNAALAMTLAASFAAGCSNQEQGGETTGPRPDKTTSTILGSATLQLCDQVLDASQGWDSDPVPSNIDAGSIGGVIGYSESDVRSYGAFGVLECPDGVQVDTISAGEAKVKTVVPGQEESFESPCVVIGSAIDGPTPPVPGSSVTTVLAVCMPPQDVLTSLKTQSA